MIHAFLQKIMIQKKNLSHKKNIFIKKHNIYLPDIYCGVKPKVWYLIWV
jgi:hypothetical protein